MTLRKGDVDLVEAMGLFDQKLYGALVEHEDKERVIYSPFSIHTCMAMALMGAEGETAQELQDLLDFQACSEDIREYAPGLYHDFLKSYQNSSVLSIANRIYVMEGFEVKDDYKELLEKDFYSGIKSIDFAKNQEAAQTINNWVENKTHDRIQDLISSDSLSADTRLVLLNAIYFNASWKYPFQESATEDKDFYMGEDGDCVQVPMMQLTHKFSYGELPDLDATAIQLPYKDTNISMLVVLPNKGTTLEKVVTGLEEYTAADLVRQMSSEDVILSLPKFKSEFEIDLKDVFEKVTWALPPFQGISIDLSFVF